MIRSALAVDLDQQDGILDVLAVPGVKGRQQLETVAASSHTNKSRLRDKQQQLKGREVSIQYCATAVLRVHRPLLYHIMQIPCTRQHHKMGDVAQQLLHWRATYLLGSTSTERLEPSVGGSLYVSLPGSNPCMDGETALYKINCKTAQVAIAQVLQ